MRRVILESPYAGKSPKDIEANVEYARAAMRDCILRDEAPYASHLLYTQPGVLKDGNADERALGMKAGMTWTSVAEAVVVYTDRGITPGMKGGIARAERLKLPVEYRSLDLTDYGMLAPAALSDLLLTIGYDVPSAALTKAAQSEKDVRDAVAWAKREHAIGQGHAPDDDGPHRAPPAWLNNLFTGERKT